MKRWELIFTEHDDGQISVSAQNQGFDGMELLALLDLKKCDVLAQISPTTVFKRTLITEDGTKYDFTEEK